MDLEKIKEHIKSLDLFTNHCGLKLEEITLGRAVMVSEPVEKIPSRNFMGKVHGGFLFTMADVASGLSVISYGDKCVTIDSSMNFIKGVESGILRAEGEVIHKGKTTAVTKVTIYNEKRQVVAVATNTMFISGEKIK